MTRTEKTHRVVLEAVDNYMSTHRYCPTTRELQHVMGYESTSTMHVHLTNMRALGYIDWVPYGPRTLHILDGGYAFLAASEA